MAICHYFDIRQLVAEHPCTPPHVLTKLALDSDWDSSIYRSVLRNSNITSTVLDEITNKFLEESKSEIRLDKLLDLINHPHISPDALLKLASLDNSETMKAIAKLSTVPPSVLAKLVAYQGSNAKVDFWENIAFNPNMTGELLEKLFIRFYNIQNLDNNERILAYIAINSNTPIHVIEKIITDEALKYLRGFVASNPNTPAYILTKLTAYFARVAEHANTPVNLLMQFAVSSNIYIRRGLASNKKAPIILLKRLVDDPDAGVRANLAKNPSIPISMLEYLAQDKDKLVRTGVTKNPKTPATLLKKLARFSDNEIRSNIAKHPNTSNETLLEMADNSNVYIRWALANSLPKRTNITGTILEKLVDIALARIERQEEEQPDIIIIEVAKHPSTPIALLEKLAFNLYNEISYNEISESILRDIQEAVASNILTPIPILDKLANKPSDILDKFIRATARRTLKSKINIAQG